MTTHDYYETLQVHPRADREAIQAAYDRLRDLYDPAQIEGAADELVELARQKRESIDRAYATLSDPVRRAAYDAERAELAAPAADEQASPTGEPELDYRPLPPAGGVERPRDFDSQPLRTERRSPGRRVGGRGASWSWLAPAAVGVVVVAIFAASLAITGGGGPPPAPPTPTPSPYDQYEPFIPQARQAAEQNPTSAQVWIDYGNVLYDSVQIVREQAPESDVYQLRVTRWLSATEAYSRALALDPSNASVRGDLAASSCFYGTGAGNGEYVRQGLDEARLAVAAAPDDPRVLLSLGHCLMSTDPPQTEEALTIWRKIVEVSPDTPFAQQAQNLIAQFGNE